MTESTQPWDLIILGGGAAGYFAAANVRKCRRVLILEKASQPLVKVRISGGGRCNLTHACFDPEELVTNYPRGADALRGAFSRFQPRDTMDWFEAHGVDLKIEPDQRVFPVSDRAQTVVDCLLNVARRAGAETWTQDRVTDVKVLSPIGEARFQVQIQSAHSRHDQRLTTRNLLFATGGDPASYRLVASLGHTIEPPVPSLFTFKITDSRLADLAGLTLLQASLRLVSLDQIRRAPVPPQQGSLLVTHRGLSGPVVLRLSAWGARWLYAQQYQACLEVNWLHPLTQEQVLSMLIHYKADPENRRRHAYAHHPFPQLPLRLWQRLTNNAGLDDALRWADLPKAILVSLAQELSAGRFTIQGKNPFKEEFVTCGGVRLSEVDFKTMQSRLVPGLFFAGEVLDIDGLTGGFNFQNAWTTAWIAAQAIGEVAYNT